MSFLELSRPESLTGLVGQTVALTDWFLVTQERIAQFADATDDRQWIHVDAERARVESPFGAPVAHGFLTLSLLSQFIRQAIRFRGGVRFGMNYGFNRVRFPGPVRPGDSIRAGFTLKSVENGDGHVHAIFEVVIESDAYRKPCCVVDWVVRYYVQPDLDAATAGRGAASTAAMATGD